MRINFDSVNSKGLFKALSRPQGPVSFGEDTTENWRAITLVSPVGTIILQAGKNARKKISNISSAKSTSADRGVPGC